MPSFTGTTLVDLHVACSYDFNLAVTKYFHSLENGEIPLCFLFSGTIFFSGQDGTLEVTQIPWENEASFRLPVSTWRSMMDLDHPHILALSPEGRFQSALPIQDPERPADVGRDPGMPSVRRAQGSAL